MTDLEKLKLSRAYLTAHLRDSNAGQVWSYDPNLIPLFDALKHTLYTISQTIADLEGE